MVTAAEARTRRATRTTAAHQARSAQQVLRQDPFLLALLVSTTCCLKLDYVRCRDKTAAPALVDCETEAIMRPGLHASVDFLVSGAIFCIDVGFRVHGYVAAIWGL